MTTVIDDIDRVCKLSDDQKKKLDLAAKGAIDKYLANWRTQMDNWVRERVNGVNEDIGEFLAGMGSVRFGNAKQFVPQRQEIWTNSLKNVLTKEQVTSYQRDLERAIRFQASSHAHVIVADLDRRVKFSPEQRAPTAQARHHSLN